MHEDNQFNELKNPFLMKVKVRRVVVILREVVQLLRLMGEIITIFKECN